VTQKIWAYIRENNLQNPKNRREIFCDEKLEELLGRKKIDMFRMTKVLSAVFSSIIPSILAPPHTHTPLIYFPQNMKSVSELQSGPSQADDDDEDDDEEEEEEEVKPTKKRRITKVEKQGNAREHLRREATQQKEKEIKKKKIAKKATSTTAEPKEKKQSALTKPVELSERLSEFLGYRIVPRTTVIKLMWKYIKEKDLQDPANRKNILCDAEMERLFGKKEFTMFEMNKYLTPVSQSSHSSVSLLFSPP
jgi:upstream activation factor subunit UAF30